jgi:hypothetical protein
MLLQELLTAPGRLPLLWTERQMVRKEIRALAPVVNSMEESTAEHGN